MDFQKVAELQYQLKKDPNSACANLDLAKYYLEEGKLMEGVCFLERAITLNSKDELSLNLLGTLYATVGQLGKAEEKFKQSLVVNPDSIEAYYNLGLLYYRQNRPKEAKICYEKLIELKPDDAEALNNLGAICFKLKQYDQAKKHILKALEIAPDYKEAFYNLADCYAKEEDHYQTYLVYEKLAELGDKDEALKQMLKLFRKKARSALVLKKGEEERIKLNIGFVSIWFERGQSYVTKALRDVVAGQHNTFVFARQGGVYGQSKLETTGFWEVPNLFTYENYDIPSEVLEKWIEENDLDAIIFNEEYDWRLIRACKNKGIKVLTYLDYYKDDWKSNMKLYDGALCSTKRTYNLIEKWCKAYYIGWGIDTELFKPAPIENKEYTFFHNAGWLGINYRKMTPAVILAFDAISKTDKNLSLLVHSQVEMEKLPDSVAKIVRENPKIDFRVQTVGSPGLYHLGKIYVYPTKLEGLGLTVIEALSCGLPVITTDAPPMNEFVKDSYNGLLVKVAKRITRQDVIAFPEKLVDLNDLAMGMYQLAKNAKLTEEMSQNARRDIEQNYNWNKKKEKIIELVSSIINK